MASDTVDADPSVWMPIAQAAKEVSPPVSRQALSKRVAAFEAAGQLATKAGPRRTKLVNVVALQRLLVDETDPAQALRNNMPEPELPLPDGDEPPVAAPERRDSSFSDNRSRHESFKAENARLDLEERLGKLVSVADVERHTMNVMRRVRDRLLGLPAQIAPDDMDYRARADREVRKVLNLLADELSEIANADSEPDSEDELEPGGAE